MPKKKTLPPPDDFSPEISVTAPAEELPEQQVEAAGSDNTETPLAGPPEVDLGSGDVSGTADVEENELDAENTADAAETVPVSDEKAEDPEYDGYLYTWAYTTKVEHPYLESKTVTETVTVNTAKNDLAQILAELSPSMPYEKDGFSGELALDHTTLSTEASGYTTKYSKTTETKVIGNLDRNDMSYVPATTVKNGKTLTLANVEWQVTGTALVGEALVPAQYQAVATYSASSSYQAATGYVTTAEYHGTVTSEGVDSITYTVVYTGSEIVPVKTHIWDNGSLAAPLLIIAAVLLCAGIAAAALILLRRRKNVYVYVPDSKPREYRLIAKFRVEPDSEVPAIDAGALTLNPGDTVAVEVKKSLARHLAGREFTVSFPQSDHTYTIQASKHNDWHEFTVPAEEEQEAPV